MPVVLPANCSVASLSQYLPLDCRPSSADARPLEPDAIDVGTAMGVSVRGYLICGQYIGANAFGPCAREWFTWHQFNLKMKFSPSLCA